MIIDISRDMISHGLYARRIWEALLKKTKAWEWKSLDSFLCDLKSFENMLDNYYKEFYWEYNENKKGYTNVLAFNRKIYVTYKINIFKNSIVITKVY